MKYLKLTADRFLAISLPKITMPKIKWRWLEVRVYLVILAGFTILGLYQKTGHNPIALAASILLTWQMVDKITARLK
jgi:hypothetical protein